VGTSEHKQISLLTDYSIDSAYSVSYHTIYSNIYFNWDSEQLKQYSIQFAIPSRCPQQASVASNVAIAAAQHGVPTIFVYADLLAPTLQQHFGLGSLPGLNQLLMEEHVSTEMLQTYVSSTFVPNLRLLCGGVTSLSSFEVSRLLSAKLQVILNATRQFMEQNDDRPGMIIFNSPPVLAGIDASLISTLVDHTLLIIARGRTTRTEAIRAQEQLQRAHAKLAGVVMLET